jgi:hypothetical protein
LKIENSHTKDEGQKFKVPYISIWYFFWLQIARWFQKCKHFVVSRSISTTVGQIRSKYLKFSNFVNFWSFWPVTFKVDLQTTFIFLESASNLQLEKVPYRYIGQLRIFDLHMRIFNLQGLGAPDKPKKKIKYAEIDFTSHHSF